MTKKQELAKLFEIYGKIEKIWFRSVPVERSGTKIPIRAAVITKKFREGSQSMNAYVLFVDKIVCY